MSGSRLNKNNKHINRSSVAIFFYYCIIICVCVLFCFFVRFSLSPTLRCRCISCWLTAILAPFRRCLSSPLNQSIHPFPPVLSRDTGKIKLFIATSDMQKALLPVQEKKRKKKKTSRGVQYSTPNCSSGSVSYHSNDKCSRRFNLLSSVVELTVNGLFVFQHISLFFCCCFFFFFSLNEALTFTQHLCVNHVLQHQLVGSRWCLLGQLK